MAFCCREGIGQVVRPVTRRRPNVRIDLDTIEKQNMMAERHGGAVASLLGLDDGLESQPLFEMERSLFGAGGEVLTRDRHVAFKSDKAFSKLKSSETIPLAEIVDLQFDGGASWTRWTFSGAPGRFVIGLVHYGSHNGIGPGEHIWYDIDTFPARSGAFVKAVGASVAGSGLHPGFDFPSTVQEHLEEAVAAFEASGRLAADRLTDVTQNDVYAPWTAVYRAFSWALAGFSASSGNDADAWLRLFGKLDGFYAKVLKRLQGEIETLGGRLLDRESAILSLNDQFERLSGIWYIRQMLRVHLADTRLPAGDIRPWTLKLLKPRARRYANELKIDLPDPSLFEEQIRELE
jgi:hypothetical protein